MAYSITEDDYFQKQQPAKSEELINIVETISVPLCPPQIIDWKLDAYKSNDPIHFDASETKTIEIKFSDIPLKSPEAFTYITDSVGTLVKNDTTGKYTNLLMPRIVSFYAWGASFTITNPDAVVSYCVIIVNGYPLKQSKSISQSRDSDSILENGELVYKVSENHLIQSQIVAQLISDTLLATYKTPRKDIVLNWRGNPSLELQDEIIVPEYNKNGIYTEGIFTIYKQITSFDGGIKQNTEARKLSNIVFKSVYDTINTAENITV